MSTAQAYDFAELEQLWEAAGGSSSLAPTMAQIGLDQSGGDPTQINNDAFTPAQLEQKGWPVPPYGEHSFAAEQKQFKYKISPEYSEGIWQANEDAAGGNYYGFTPGQLYDNPTAQAQAAVAAEKAQGLGAWAGDAALSGSSGSSAPATGAQATGPATATQSSVAGSIAGSLVSPAWDLWTWLGGGSSLGSDVAKVGTFLLAVAVGGALVVAGGYKAIAGSKPVQDAKADASQAASQLAPLAEVAA